MTAIAAASQAVGSRRQRSMASRRLAEMPHRPGRPPYACAMPRTATRAWFRPDTQRVQQRSCSNACSCARQALSFCRRMPLPRASSASNAGAQQDAREAGAHARFPLSARECAPPRPQSVERFRGVLAKQSGSFNKIRSHGLTLNRVPPVFPRCQSSFDISRSPSRKPTQTSRQAHEEEFPDGRASGPDQSPTAFCCRPRPAQCRPWRGSSRCADP